MSIYEEYKAWKQSKVGQSGSGQKPSNSVSIYEGYKQWKQQKTGESKTNDNMSRIAERYNRWLSKYQSFYSDAVDSYNNKKTLDKSGYSNYNATSAALANEANTLKNYIKLYYGDGAAEYINTIDNLSKGLSSLDSAYKTRLDTDQKYASMDEDTRIRTAAAALAENGTKNLESTLKQTGISDRYNKLWNQYGDTEAKYQNQAYNDAYDMLFTSVLGTKSNDELQSSAADTKKAYDAAEKERIKYKKYVLSGIYKDVDGKNIDPRSHTDEYKAAWAEADKKLQELTENSKALEKKIYQIKGVTESKELYELYGITGEETADDIQKIIDEIKADSDIQVKRFSTDINEDPDANNEAALAYKEKAEAEIRRLQAYKNSISDSKTLKKRLSTLDTEMSGMNIISDDSGTDLLNNIPGTLTFNEYKKKMLSEDGDFWMKSETEQRDSYKQYMKSNAEDYQYLNSESGIVDVQYAKKVRDDALAKLPPDVLDLLDEYNKRITTVQKPDVLNSLKKLGYTEKEVMSLAEYRKFQLDEKKAAKESAENRDLAKMYPVGSSIGSVVGMPFKWLGAGAEMINSMFYANKEQPLNINSDAMSLQRFVDDVRGQVSEDIKDGTNWGNVKSFIYQTGLSILDSTISVAMLREGAIYLMGLNAATSTAKEITERGGSKWQAFAGGIASGFFEAFFEKFSIENLLDAGSVEGIADLFKSFAKQGFIELSEESLTELANLTFDYINMHEKSQLSSQSLISSLGQVGLSALGGFISGLFMGGFVNTFHYVQSSNNTKAYGNIMNAEGLKDYLRDTADRNLSPDITDQANKLIDKLDKNVKITDKEAGDFYKDVATAEDAQAPAEGEGTEEGVNTGTVTDEYLKQLAYETIDARSKEAYGEAGNLIDYTASSATRGLNDELLNNKPKAVNLDQKKTKQLVNEAERYNIFSNVKTQEANVEAPGTTDEVKSEAEIPAIDTVKTVETENAPVDAVNKDNKYLPGEETADNAKAIYNGAEVTVKGLTEDGKVKITDQFGVERIADISEVEIKDANVAEMYKLSQGMSNSSMARTMVNTYDGSVPAATYKAAYISYYFAGFEGKEYNAFDAGNEFTDSVNYIAKIAAYEAGQNYRVQVDARSTRVKGEITESLRNSKQAAAERAAQRAQNQGNNEQNKKAPGVERHYNQKLTAHQTAFLKFADALGKKLNRTIEVYDTLGENNGSYNPGTDSLRIALDSALPYLSVTSHEMTHEMQVKAPVLYEEMKAYIRESVGTEKFDARVDAALAAHPDWSTDYAIEEETARYCEKMLESSDKMLDVKENHSKLYNFIVNVLKKIKKLFDAVINTNTNNMASQQALDLVELDNFSAIYEMWVNGIVEGEGIIPGKVKVAETVQKTNETAAAGKVAAAQKTQEAAPAPAAVESKTQKFNNAYIEQKRQNAEKQINNLFKGIELATRQTERFNEIKTALLENASNYGNISLDAFLSDSNVNKLFDLYNEITEQDVSDETKANLYWALYHYGSNFNIAKNFTQEIEDNSSKTYASSKDEDYVDVEKRLKAAQSVNMWLRKQISLSAGHVLDYESIYKLAGDILTRYGSKYSRADLTFELNKIFHKLANARVTDYDRIMEQMAPVALNIANSAEVEDNMYHNILAGFRSDLHDNGIRLSDDIKSEIEKQTGMTFEEYRKKHFGTIIFKKSSDVSEDTGGSEDAKTLSLDEFYHKYADDENYEELFNGNEATGIAQLNEILRVREMANVIKYNPFEEKYGVNYYNKAIDEISSTIYEAYFDIPEVQTFAGAKSQALAEARVEYKQALSNMRQTERSIYKQQLNDIKAADREFLYKALDARDQELVETQTKYKNKLAQMRQTNKQKVDDIKSADREFLWKMLDARKNAEDIRKAKAGVTRNVKSFTNKIVNESKNVHILESMKEPILDLLETLRYYTNDNSLAVYTDRGERIRNAWYKDNKVIYVTELNKAFTSLADKYKALKDAAEEANKATDKSNKDNLKENTKGSIIEKSPLPYSEEVYNKLYELASMVEGKNNKNITLKEWQRIDEILKVFSKMVNDANTIFLNGKKQAVSERGQEAINKMSRMKQMPAPMLGKIQTDLGNFLKSALLQPITFFQQLSDTPILDAFHDIYDGEDKATLIKKNALDFAVNCMKTNNITAELLDQKVKFKDLEFTVESLMSLIATYKREIKEDTYHIREGGITLDKNSKVEATVLSELELADLYGKLPKNARKFMDEMVKFSSTVLSKYGNEISMAMYGIPLYNEEYYFTIKVNQDVISEDPTASKTKKPSSPGFSHALQHKANAPIIIKPFLQVWSEHVNQMAMYNGVAIPIDNMLKLWNFKDGNRSVKTSITGVLGKRGNDYIRAYISDISNNKDIEVPRGSEFQKTLFSWSKAKMVAGKISVTVQQLSALPKAFSMINPKYIVSKDSLKHLNLLKEYREAKAFIPVYILKEWGGFDVGYDSGFEARMRSEAFKDTKTWLRDNLLWGEIFFKGMQKMDETTWGLIYVMVKNETADLHKDVEPMSEDWMQIVRKRVTEIVRENQIYDSINSRSSIVRSKSGFNQVATAFMSEPIEMYNMLYRAQMFFANGKKAKAARYTAAVISSMVLNAFVKALVQAMKDDDKDKDGTVRTYGEKYIDAVVGNLISSPFEMIPFLNQLSSVIRGFTIKDLSWDLISKTMNNVKKAIKDPTTNNVTDAVTLLTQLCSSVPAKNIKDDVLGLYNTFYDIATGYVHKKEAVTDMSFTLAERFSAARENFDIKKRDKDGSLNSSVGGVYYDLYYEALTSGDKQLQTEMYNYIRKSGRDVDTIEKAVKSRLAGKKDGQLVADERVQRMAAAYEKGDMATYKAVLAEMKALGFTQDVCIMAMNVVRNSKYSANASATKIDDAGEGDNLALYDWPAMYYAIESNDVEDIEAIKDYFIDEIGLTEDSMRSSLTRHFKPLYVAGTDEVRKQIRDILVKSFGYNNKTISKWLD